MKGKFQIISDLANFVVEQKDISITIRKNGEATIHLPYEDKSLQMNILVYKENVVKE